MRWPLAPLLLAGALACTEPPEVSGVDPAQGRPGTAFQVQGERFTAGTTLTLSPQGGGEATELAISRRSPEALHSTIPEGTAAGTYDLLVATPNQVLVLDGGFEVVAPPVDTPCGHLYTANTAVNLGTGEVVVDRFFPDDKRETVRVPLTEIARVEYERLAQDGGKTCHVVYLRRKEGGRLRFMDDAEVDLKARAYKLAQELGVPVEVTREDPVATPDDTDAAATGQASDKAAGG